MAYPNDIYDPREKENVPSESYVPENKTRLFAEDVSFLDDEVVAIEETLGTNPEGIFETVRDRLDQMAPGGESVKNIFFDRVIHNVPNWILVDRLLQNELITLFDNQTGAIQGLFIRVITGPDSVTANITLTYINGAGDEIIQTIPIDVGPNTFIDYPTLHGCIRITSIEVIDLVGFGALYSVGVDTRFGVPNFPLGADSDILKVMWNGRDLTDYTIDLDFGLIDVFGLSITPLDNVGILYKPS